MFISLVIAMVLIPANTATANEFMQNRKEYETALNHTVTLTARLKQDTEKFKTRPLSLVTMMTLPVLPVRHCNPN